MTPIEIPGANVSLTPPTDWDEARDGVCMTLRVLRATDEDGRPVVQSAWRPSDIELTALVNGHAVLFTTYGRSHPPVWIGVTEKPVP
jgi:hypothetical protein